MSGTLSTETKTELSALVAVAQQLPEIYQQRLAWIGEGMILSRELKDENKTK